MLVLLLTALSLIVLAYAYKIIKSIRFKNFYAKQAAQKGYLVFQQPYAFMSSAIYAQWKRQEKIHNDSHYHYKNELSKYDMIVSNIMSATLIQVMKPELIKQFYSKLNEGFYVKSEMGFGHIKRLIGSQSVFVLDGEAWKSKRKLLSTVFNFDFIVKQIPKIQEITREVFDQLEGKGGNEQIQCNIMQPLMTIFSTTILKCFFKSEGINKIGNQRTVDFLNKLIIKIATSGRSKLGVVLGIKYTRMGLTSLDRIINKQISLFRQASKQMLKERIKELTQKKSNNDENNNKKALQFPDIIEAFMKNNLILPQKEEKNDKKSQEAQKQLKNNEQQCQKINLDSILGQFVTFFIAGSETTSSMTRMMIYRLACHPQILEKVREQFQRVVKTDEITYEQLKNLKYFEKVQKQVLRMDSSVGGISVRIATKDHYLGDLKIYKGMAVSLRIRGVHYKQSEHFSPNTFNPERWDQKNIKNNFSYIPFSAGSRNCIGLHLAQLQNKIVMIQLLRRFKDIKIPKRVQEIKMRSASFYEPQPITTTLIRRNDKQIC